MLPLLTAVGPLRSAPPGARCYRPPDAPGYHFPAEHWKHLRTTNPIESTFATVKLRQRVTKGAGSRRAGLAMAFRLLLLAQASWRRLDGRELLPLVRAGATFKDGVRAERDEAQESKISKVKPRKKRVQDQSGKVAA